MPHADGKHMATPYSDGEQILCPHLHGVPLFGASQYLDLPACGKNGHEDPQLSMTRSLKATRIRAWAQAPVLPRIFGVLIGHC